LSSGGSPTGTLPSLAWPIKIVHLLTYRDVCRHGHIVRDRIARSKSDFPGLLVGDFTNPARSQIDKFIGGISVAHGLDKPYFLWAIMGHALQPGIVRAILQKDGLSVYEERRLRNCAVIHHQFDIYPTTLDLLPKHFTGI